MDSNDVISETNSIWRFPDRYLNQKKFSNILNIPMGVSILHFSPRKLSLLMISSLSLPKNIIIRELVEQACQVVAAFDISYVVQGDRRAVACFRVDIIFPLAR